MRDGERLRQRQLSNGPGLRNGPLVLTQRRLWPPVTRLFLSHVERRVRRRQPLRGDGTPHLRVRRPVTPLVLPALPITRLRACLRVQADDPDGGIRLREQVLGTGSLPA